MAYKNFEQRFWSKVEILSFDDCWLWTGGKTNRYGILSVHPGEKNQKRRKTAHALSWIMSFGDIPNDIHVGHKCSNRSCVNPKHLYLTSHKENMRERTYRDDYLYPEISKNKIICAQKTAIVHKIRYLLRQTDIIENISDEKCIKIFEAININTVGDQYSNFDINRSIDSEIQICGHPKKYIVSSNSGTNFCLMCEYLEKSNFVSVVMNAVEAISL